MDSELLMSLLPTWQSLSSAIDLHAPELSPCPYGTDQSPGCFFTPYWDKSTESSDGLVFDSGISSLASSPVSQPNTSTDGFLMRELIAMLGESPPPTYNSGHPFKENAPGWGHATSPVNLGARSFNGRAGQYQELATMEMRMMSRVSSSPSLQPVGSLFGAPRGSTSPNPASQDRAELSNSLSEASWRKRKAATRRKEAEVEDDSGSGTKRAKQSDGGNGNENGSVKAEEEEEKGGSDENAEIGDVKDEKLQVKDNETRPPEPPRDYIHVRARRGQATDSHSLAERVRREKISERMKILQDLVPGCSKVVLEKNLKLEETPVTGKALMLDEIINYVQSLQRQVEFLSMKLASVDPGNGPDSNTNTPTVKDVFEPDSTDRNRMFRLDSSAPALYAQRNQAANISDRAILQCPVDPLNNTQFLPYQAFLGGDLHSIIQMGYGQN